MTASSTILTKRDVRFVQSYDEWKEEKKKRNTQPQMAGRCRQSAQLYTTVQYSGIVYLQSQSRLQL